MKQGAIILACMFASGIAFADTTPIIGTLLNPAGRI